MAPRHSAAVYRRRRLAVLIALILLLVVIGLAVWMLIAKPWAGGVSPAPSSSASAPPVTPSASAGDSPLPSAAPSGEATPGVVACEAADITVQAVTDADTYAAGVLPKLSISLTNNGAKDCTMNVGSTHQEFTVSSGSDVWWRSTDCQENPSDMVATLTAGQTVTSADPVVWDRTRSSTDTCAQENRPRAAGAGASYHVAVSIGGFESATTKQIQLY